MPATSSVAGPCAAKAVFRVLRPGRACGSIEERARERERERDRASAEAERLLHQHHRLANAVALFQVSIALGAVGALARNKLVWLGSLIGGVGGLATALYALLA